MKRVGMKRGETEEGRRSSCLLLRRAPPALEAQSTFTSAALHALRTPHLGANRPVNPDRQPRAVGMQARSGVGCQQGLRRCSPCLTPPTPPFSGSLAVAVPPYPQTWNSNCRPQHHPVSSHLSPGKIDKSENRRKSKNSRKSKVRRKINEKSKNRRKIEKSTKH